MPLVYFDSNLFRELIQVSLTNPHVQTPCGGDCLDSDLSRFLSSQCSYVERPGLCPALNGVQ